MILLQKIKKRCIKKKKKTKSFEKTVHNLETKIHNLNEQVANLKIIKNEVIKEKDNLTKEIKNLQKKNLKQRAIKSISAQTEFDLNFPKISLINNNLPLECTSIGTSTQVSTTSSSVSVSSQTINPAQQFHTLLPTVAYPSTASDSVSSSSSIPPTPTTSPLSPLTPSPASTATALTTKANPVLPSPLGEAADKFKEQLMKQQKAIEDWFENHIDEG